jgi:hypothetical protein
MVSSKAEDTHHFGNGSCGHLVLDVNSLTNPFGRTTWRFVLPSNPDGSLSHLMGQNPIQWSSPTGWSVLAYPRFVVKRFLKNLVTP